MKWAIWKYPVPIRDTFSLDMPIGSQMLSVQVQGESWPEQVNLWALVDTEAPKEPRRFRLFGTGWPISDDPGRFIGTFQLNHGAYVFHVFEERQP